MLALGRDPETLPIESVCEPVLRRTELGRDQGNPRLSTNSLRLSFFILEELEISLLFRYGEARRSGDDCH